MRRRAAAALFVLAACAAGAPRPAQAADRDTCVSCHLKEREVELRAPVAEWRESVHARALVSCDGCHGGDPRVRSAKRSMSAAAGFLENPSWREMADYCGVCHEALAESWLAGSLGRGMREGVRVASCKTCHMSDGHRIVSAGAADLKVAGRCRSCSPIEDSEGAAARLGAVSEQRRSAGDLVARATQLGIDASDLSDRLRASRASFSRALHRFDPSETALAEAAARRELGDIRDTAGELIREAGRRRRYGLALLSVLSVLFASLVLLRRRLA